MRIELADRYNPQKKLYLRSILKSEGTIELSIDRDKQTIAIVTVKKDELIRAIKAL